MLQISISGKAVSGNDSSQHGSHLLCPGHFEGAVGASETMVVVAIARGGDDLTSRPGLLVLGCRDQLMTFLLAGADTTSATLALCLFEIA